MTPPNDAPPVVDGIAQLRATWDTNPLAIHKRPPFRAHSFDDDDRFWVVGSTNVSVLHGAHGSREWADQWAAVLNEKESADVHG